jgi:hypothetical protein
VPVGAENFFLHDHVQTDSGAHPASYSMGTRGSFPRGKAAGAEVMNAWRYASTPPIRLQGVVASQKSRGTTLTFLKSWLHVI